MMSRIVKKHKPDGARVEEKSALFGVTEDEDEEGVKELEPIDS